MYKILACYFLFNKLINFYHLARDGVYANVVETVWEAFKTSEVLRLDCAHVGTSDCKKIGVKLRVCPLCLYCESEDSFVP